MADLSGGFIAMPGGYGTFEEFFEVVTWTQPTFHSKPCSLLNVASFYDWMLDMIKHARWRSTENLRELRRSKKDTDYAMTLVAFQRAKSPKEKAHLAEQLSTLKPRQSHIECSYQHCPTVAQGDDDTRETSLRRSGCFRTFFYRNNSHVRSGKNSSCPRVPR